MSDEKRSSTDSMFWLTKQGCGCVIVVIALLWILFMVAGIGNNLSRY